MKNWFKVLISITAIVLGLYGIFKIVGVMEISIGLFSLTFGVMAIIWTILARKSLSPGSQLKEYATIFLICLVFILAYSVWELLEKLIGWTGSAIYPKYFFITISYLGFVTAAYKMFSLSKEFGFSDKSDTIAKIIAQRVKKKKGRKKK
jgi:hypothetical protein